MLEYKSPFGIPGESLKLRTFRLSLKFPHNPAVLRYIRFRYLFSLSPSPRPSPQRRIPRSNSNKILIKLRAGNLHDATNVSRRYSENTEDSPVTECLLCAVDVLHVSHRREKRKIIKATSAASFTHGSLRRKLRAENVLLLESGPNQSEIRSLCSRGEAEAQSAYGYDRSRSSSLQKLHPSWKYPRIQNLEPLRRERAKHQHTSAPPEQASPQTKRKVSGGAKFICTPSA